MTAINKVRHGVTTLVAKANHDALVARSKTLGENTAALGNNRLGLVLVTDVVRPIANALNDALAKLYETTIRQFPKADRSELQVGCRDGLDAYIAACAPIGRNSSAFGDSRMEVFTRTLSDEAERLRNDLDLKLANVIPPPRRGLQKTLIEDHPNLTALAIAFAAAVGGGIVLKMMGMVG